MYQPAVHAKDQKEVDLWAKFYKLLNDAHIIFGSDFFDVERD